MSATTENVGRFASTALLRPGEQPVARPVVGLRYDRIEVRLTHGDFMNPAVQDWLRRLTTRVSDARRWSLMIKVVP